MTLYCRTTKLKKKKKNHTLLTESYENYNFALFIFIK